MTQRNKQKHSCLQFPTATTAISTPPPLERIFPYIVSGPSVAVSIASAIISFAISIVTRSIGLFSPLPIILYLFAPLTVFLEIATDIFIRWPRLIALYVLDAVYPIYVFCGVACTVGILVGGTGRPATQVLVDLVTVKEDPKPEAKVGVEVRKSKRKLKVEEDD